MDKGEIKGQLLEVASFLLSVIAQKGEKRA